MRDWLAGLLRSNAIYVSMLRNRHGACIATSDKRRQRFTTRRESGLPDVEMSDVSCGIYDDVGRLRVYYLVRRRETDDTMIDAENRRKGEPEEPLRTLAGRAKRK